eukprot:449595-Pyramimonas_sp.AAC.1
MVATVNRVLPVPGGPCTIATRCRMVAVSALTALPFRRRRLAASLRLSTGGRLRTRWKTCPIDPSTSSSVNGVTACALLRCCGLVSSTAVTP